MRSVRGIAGDRPTHVAGTLYGKNDAPRIVGIDDHIVEPPDIFRNHVPASYLDRAPKLLRDEHGDGGESFHGESGKGEGETSWAAGAGVNHALPYKHVIPSHPPK